MTPAIKIWAGKPPNKAKQNSTKIFTRHNLKSAYWRKPMCMNGILDKMPALNYTDFKKIERKKEGGRYFKCLLQI